MTSNSIASITLPAGAYINFGSASDFLIGTSDRTDGNNVIWSGSPYVIEDIVVTTEPSKKTKPKKVNKTNSGLRKPTDMERRRIIDV